MSESEIYRTAEKVDPDPLTVVALVLSGCALITSVIQAANSSAALQQTIDSPKQISESVLEHLGESARKVEQSLNSVLRSIEKGSDKPDTEFFDARFGIDQSRLFLSPVYYEQFADRFAELFTNLGNMGRWINAINHRHPDVGLALSRQMKVDIGQVSERLNSILSQGKANREILELFRTLLGGLIDAVDRLERGSN